MSLIQDVIPMKYRLMPAKKGKRIDVKTEQKCNVCNKPFMAGLFVMQCSEKCIDKAQYDADNWDIDR